MPAKRKAFPLILILLSAIIALCGCTVEIYDLQPVLPTVLTPTPFRTATPVSRQALPLLDALATSTPPIHLAPTPVTVQTAVDILDVRMIDGGIGWAIAHLPNGIGKLIVRTIDGGETWENVTPPELIYDNLGRNLEPAAYFIDANQAFILYWETDRWTPERGVQVYRTRDAGASWTPFDLPIEGYTLQQFSDVKIRFLTPQFGWIFATLSRTSDLQFVGLYTTVNGGDSWNMMISSDSTNMPPKGIKNGAVFRNAAEGWISGTNPSDSPGTMLYQTKDGGNRWAAVPLPDPVGDGVPSDLFTSGIYSCEMSVPVFVDILYQYAWSRVACRGGSIDGQIAFVYWTYDSGATWLSYKLPAAVGHLTFYGIYQGWYSVPNDGEDPSFPFKILTTQDGGSTWMTIANTAWDSRLQFITPAIGFGIVDFQGRAAFVKSTDGGYNWVQSFPMLNPD